MKRVFLIVAVLLIAVMGVASADTYTFPNGVTWDSTPEQVIAIEGRQPDSSWDPGTGLKAYLFYNVAISKFDATRGYWYVNNQLFEVRYTWAGKTASDDWKYLYDALSSVYGEAVELTADDLEKTRAFMYNVESTDFDYSVYCDLIRWTVSEQLEIRLYRSNDGRAINLEYVNIALQDGDVLNTSGL